MAEREQRDFNSQKFVQESLAEIKKTVGDKKVLCALSGGVDSSVVAALLYKAIGSQLTCVFVDTGLMRKDEGNEVCTAFKEAFGADVVRIDAEQRFLDKLKGVTDPEEKRKIVGEEFIRVFEDEGKKLGKVHFLAQGTIYPDIIESGTKKEDVIKSHHNVGGLPDVIDFDELLEPLKYLYKDEVRLAGKELGLPDYLVMRQPFPGPGLSVRCIGEITKDKLDILREADFIFRDEIAKAGYDTKIWQYFAVMTGLRSVGAKNGKRTYGYTIALRAVNSVDAMTGTWVKVPYEILEVVSERIVSEVAEVNRVVFDITNKPPSTIEWE